MIADSYLFTKNYRKTISLLLYYNKMFTLNNMIFRLMIDARSKRRTMHDARHASRN